jgi:O-antigen/teichoic acid export membrane protein
MGIVGAALATVIGYFVVEATLYPIVQRFYHIDYEWSRIGKLVLTVVSAYVVVSVFDLNVAYKLGLFVLWCGSLFAVRFFSAGELKRMKDIFRNTA